jgi:hypothetical protein
VPPLHPHCRSILVPVEKEGKLPGERPFVMDERKVKDIPKDERSQLIGQLDANTTFKEFFKKTDDFFQKEWLGPKRFKLYKEGKFDFEKFFNVSFLDFSHVMCLQKGGEVFSQVCDCSGLVKQLTVCCIDKNLHVCCGHV